MAPRKTVKRVETEVIDTAIIVENSDVSIAKKKKIQLEEVTKEVRLPRAAKNKKLDSELTLIKLPQRQKSAIKKGDFMEKKNLGKNIIKKIETQDDDTEQVESEEIIEKSLKKGRVKAEKKSDILIEKNYETDFKNKVDEEKASSIIKKGKGRGNKAEVFSRKGRGKKDIENDITTVISDVKNQDNEKEIDVPTEIKENGVEVEKIENGKELSEEKTDTKQLKKGKGKTQAKKGKAVSKFKITTEINGANEEDILNQVETGITNSV